MAFASPGEGFDFSTYGFASGLEGVLGYRIQQHGVDVQGRTTDGVVESPEGTGVYQIEVDAAPESLGSYTIVIDDGDSRFVSEDLLVVGSLPTGAVIEPDLSPLALCTVEDVVDLLGLTEDDQVAARRQTIIRTINAASRAIPRRAQRDFVVVPAQQVRWKLLENSDARRRYARVGDMKEVPLSVTLVSPDRDDEFEYATDDYFCTPDQPDFGWPACEYLNFKSRANALVAGWWLKVEGLWGFPGGAPEDVREIAIGTAAEWIANDVMKQSELARQQGRRLRMEGLIPDRFLITLDEYRSWRVA